MSSKGSVFKRCGCTEPVIGSDGEPQRDKQGRVKRRKPTGGCPQLYRRNAAGEYLLDKNGQKRWSSEHGAWYYALSRTGKHGKREQRIRGGYTSQTEAQAALDDAKATTRNAASINSDRTTVGDYLEQWMRGKADIAGSTVRSYRQHIDRHLQPHLGHLRLVDLQPGHVSDMLADADVGASTRQRIRATLRSALSDAMREQRVSINAAALVKVAAAKRPKALVWTDARIARWRDTGESPSPVMVWSPAQIGTFLDTATRDRLSALYHLIAHRGLRRGEACGIEWQDVDLEAGELRVQRQLVQLGWDVDETTPKSDAGNRVVSLDSGTVAALREHRTRQVTDRVSWGPGWTDSGKVFTTEDGRALHPATVTDTFHKLAQQAGLPPIRLHDLRHGAASLMLAAGVPMKEVQETLGHSSIALTSDTYTSVYPQVAQASAEAAAAIVPRAATGTGDSNGVNQPLSHTLTDHQRKEGNRWSHGGPPGARTRNMRIKSTSGESSRESE